MVYLPQHFAATDIAAMHRLIESFPLGTLVTIGDEGLAANHIPFVLDTHDGDYGRLLGHVARDNPLWQDHEPDQNSLVVFQSIGAYITPNWYATKRETHEVVPTWNYAVVQAYGRLIVHDDAKWVRGQAGMLTKRHEASQPIPWKMADAPREYVAANLERIVGIEIPIARLVGKFKLSQNRKDDDRAGAINGLRESGEPGNLVMAELMDLIHRRD